MSGRQPQRTTPKRSRWALDGVEKGSSSSGSAMAPSLTPPDLTVADADVLDCGVCFLPLKPPIFQCDVGHVLCSPCCDKLKGAGGCPVCGVAMAGGYRRCHAMERVVESVRAPCPNARYGCDAVPAYHGREQHVQACPHAPCHCPGEACGFVGSTAALLDHVATAHGWPCEHEPNGMSRYLLLRLRVGFNFLGVSDDDDERGNKYLFLLNVTRHPSFRAVSVICIHPRAITADEEREFCLRYHYAYSSSRNKNLFSYEQEIGFRVGYSDLSAGPPDFNDCLQFIMPNYAHVDDEDYIEVMFTTNLYRMSEDDAESEDT